VLTSLPCATQQSDIDRAQWQIKLNFERFSDPEMPVSRTPMWTLLLKLRENIQESPAQSLEIQGNMPTAPTMISQNLATMAFTGGLMSESDLYSLDSESYMYEDQFMQDLPW